MSIWRTGLVARICVASSVSAVAVVLVASNVRAQSREVLIGVVSIGQPAAPNSQPRSDDAAEFYREAIAALRNGQTQSAQRQLEQLVARYPESDSASRAREDLVGIYTKGSAVRQQATLPGSSQVSYLGSPQTEKPMVPPAINEWRTSVKAATGFAKSAQDEFRSASGDLVFFAEGSAELGARARRALAQQAEWLKLHPERKVVVEGHADEPGSAEDLKTLSAARAEVVRTRLVEDGVKAERLRTVAYGRERRVAQCDDHACASQNRRAITLIDNSTAGAASPR